MRLSVVDERKAPIREPYVLRLSGWSLDRYLREAPEDARWEFVRGEVIVYSPSTAEHQDLVGFLYTILKLFCEAKGCGKVLTGPAAVRLAPDVVREPDVFVVRPEDIPKATGVPLDLVPLFAIEVVSPSTRGIDLGEKAGDYAAAGVPEYWAVDPERRELSVHLLEGKSYRVVAISEGTCESRAIPGFRIRVEWLWERPLPKVTKILPELLG